MRYFLLLCYLFVQIQTFATGTGQSDSAKTEVKEIEVADINFFCPGLETIREYREKNNNKPFSDQPVFYFAFEKDDEIILNLNLTKGVFSCSYFISKYPEDTRLIGSLFVTKLEDFRLKIKAKGIYKFTFISDNYYDGIASLNIRRKPSSVDNSNFITNVQERKVYKPVTLIVPSVFKSKGKSGKIIVPVPLPENTEALYIKSSIYANVSDAENNISKSDLAGRIQKMTGNEGFVKDLNLPFEKLKTRDTIKYDLYLLDKLNSRKYKKNHDGAFQSVYLNPLNDEISFALTTDSVYNLVVKMKDLTFPVALIEVIALKSEKYLSYGSNSNPLIIDTSKITLRRKEYIKSQVFGGNFKCNLKLLPKEYQKGHIYY